MSGGVFDLIAVPFEIAVLASTGRLYRLDYSPTNGKCLVNALIVDIPAQYLQMSVFDRPFPVSSDILICTVNIYSAGLLLLEHRDRRYSTDIWRKIHGAER